MSMTNTFDIAFDKCEWQFTIPNDEPNLPGFEAAVSDHSHGLLFKSGYMAKAVDDSGRRAVIIFTACDNVVIHEKYAEQEKEEQAFCVEMNSLVGAFTGVRHNLDAASMLTLLGDQQTPNIGVNMKRFLTEMSMRSMQKWWKAFQSDFEGDELNTLPPGIHLD